MKLEKISKQGTTISRKAFWDNVSDLVSLLQKKEGSNVKVTEHQGYGTIINVTRERGSATGATGACCRGTDCTVETQTSCESDGGIYQGDNTDCDPNPCVECIPCLDVQTNGLLIVGVTYKISSYVSGDDFTNVGAASNADGEIFAATGTTPADWSNGSGLVVNKLYVVLSGVLLCSCVNPGGGTSFSMIDGHFPGGTDTGINAQWTAELDFLNHYQGSTGNATGTDPYAYPLEFDGEDCTGDPVGVDLSSCIINVSCNSETQMWSITIEHSGFGTIFQGSGCGVVGEPILNDFSICDGSSSPRQIGYDGEAIISLTP